MDSLDDDLKYAIEVEGKWDLSDAENYEEVRDEIKELLEDLRDNPFRDELPLIYHLDVGSHVSQHHSDKQVGHEKLLRSMLIL